MTLNRFFKILWAGIWFVPAVTLLYMAGFILGIANLENPFKKAAYIVRTT